MNDHEKQGLSDYKRLPKLIQGKSQKKFAQGKAIYCGMGTTVGLLIALFFAQCSFIAGLWAFNFISGFFVITGETGKYTVLRVWNLLS